MIQLEKIKHAIAATIAKGEKLIATIERMKNVQCSGTAAAMFAAKIIELRGLDPEYFSTEKNIDLRSVLSSAISIPRRAGDQSNDLWTVLNRTQEVAIQGQTRVIRGIKSIDSTCKVNEGLFEYAMLIAA